MKKIAVLLVLVALLIAPIAFASACRGFMETTTYTYWVSGYSYWVDTSHYVYGISGTTSGGLVKYARYWVNTGYWEYVNGYWDRRWVTTWRSDPQCGRCQIGAPH